MLIGRLQEEQEVEKTTVVHQIMNEPLTRGRYHITGIHYKETTTYLLMSALNFDHPRAIDFDY
jgi:hypothetical protein